MSRKYESDCVDCGLPCLGYSCPHYQMIINMCDICKNGNAKYQIDNEDMCEDCTKRGFEELFQKLSQQEKEKALGITADELLKEVFDELTDSEKAEVLGIDLNIIND